MIPILYPADETAFDSNGIGMLSDMTEAEVIQALNGEYEFEFKYPVQGNHFLNLKLETIVTAKPDPVSSDQPFRIYRITKPMNGLVSVYARHIAYDLRGTVIPPMTADSCPAALAAMKEKAIPGCPFVFWTDKTTAATMTVTTPTAIWTQLGGAEGSVLDTYGGEYEFDRYTVKLHNRRGADRGVSIRYGKNLTSLEQDENCANVYTGVYPFWTGSSGELVQLAEKIIRAEGNYTREKIMPLDLSLEFETAPTEEQLRARAEKYMSDNDIGTPVVSWTVEFVQLEQTEEYKGKALLERVLIGDMVSVEFEQMSVSASARAVEVRFDPLLERYKSITLGSVKASLASTIAQQGQSIQQLQKPSSMQTAVDRATSWITGGGGYMVAVRDVAGNWIEQCSLDNPDINKAVNVWRWNNGGFGHSSNGYNGPYRVAITQDGHIVADFITTGTLDASLLKAGIIMSADGTVQIDLSNNKVTVMTLTDGRQGKIELASNGIIGYGWDVTKNAFYKTLRIDPGGKSDSGVESMTTITSEDSDAGLSLAAGKKGSRSRLGQWLAETEIIGSTIYINGKTASWKDNGDGTCTLIGS